MKAAIVSNWWRTIKQARARWAEVDGDQRAAAFSYYLLLSLLPLALLFVAAGSLFVEREVATQAVVKLVNYYTPAVALPFRLRNSVGHLLLRGAG